MRKVWPIVAVLLVVVAASALTTIKPFRASGGVQMQPSTAWNGPNDMGGVYYKADAGLAFHTMNGEEYVLPKTGGGASAPLALIAGTDATKGLTIQPHSATQSADVMQLLDPSGTAVMSWTPVLSAEAYELQLLANSVSSYLWLNVTNTAGGQYRCLLNGTTLQCGVGTFAFMDAGFSTTRVQFDGNGVTSNGTLGFVFPDATNQITAAPTGTLTSGRFTLSNGTRAVTDSSAFTFSGTTATFTNVTASALTKTQRLANQSSTPTIAVGAGTQLGTSPSASIAGGDLGGNLTLTTGTSPAAFTANTAVTLGTVTFNTTYSGAPKSGVLTPCNGNAANVNAATTAITAYIDQATFSTTQFTVKLISGGTPTLAASTAYQFCYVVIQ